MIVRLLLFLILSCSFPNVISQNIGLYSNPNGFIELSNDSIASFSFKSKISDTIITRVGWGIYSFTEDSLIINSLGINSFESRTFYRQLEFPLVGDVKFSLESFKNDSLVVKGPFYNNQENVDSIKKRFLFVSRKELKDLRFKSYWFNRKLAKSFHEIVEDKKRVLKKK